MKKLLAAIALLLLVPAMGLAQIEMTELSDHASGSTLVAFTAAQDGVLPDMTRMALEMQIEARFAQSAAQAALSRTGVSIKQRGWLYQDDGLVSMALLWQGDHADGSEGCTAAALTVSLETGMELYLDELFDEPDAAIADMEAIIERDVLAQMNAYMEHDDLLPMPRSSFYADETGLTVFWPQERYSTFDGTCGYVTFYWHEMAEYIGESSPVYALSRPQAADAQAVRSAAGHFGAHELLGVGQPLGAALDAYGLTDEPDYTTDSILYPVDDPALRGMSVEIPKYAETAPQDTPISAVRHSRVSWHGLTTGLNTRDEIIALLGEPDMMLIYDEDRAYDMLLEPGESLVYTCERLVLEAHLDEEGVLDCLILRDAMPETLY